MESKLIQLLECKQEVIGELYNELVNCRDKCDASYDLFMGFIGDTMQREEKFVEYLHNKLIKADDHESFDYVMREFSDYIDFEYLDSIGVVQTIR